MIIMISRISTIAPPGDRMTPAQTRLIRHAIGLENGKKKSYRNRYLAPHAGKIVAAWTGLVKAGMAEQGDTSRIGVWFYVTDAGARAVLLPGESLDAEDFPAAAAAA